jgi:hypothetical protein
MAEPAPQRSLKRVWIWVLVFIVVMWALYALLGGPSTPNVGPPVDEAAQQP